MSKRSPVAVFLAASALLGANALQPEISQAANRKEVLEEKHVHQERMELHSSSKKKGKKDGMGGLKEWTTDQDIDDESTLDDSAKKAAKKAKEKDYCIPIGEGENCW